MKEKSRKKKSKISRILNTTGTTMIVIVVLLCFLLLLPRLFGCQMYHVLSGSMEPAIPVGSLIYVQRGAPEDIKEQDVIAFYGSLEDDGIITHRVMKNNIVSGTFQTKGDANADADPMPVPYENYIGRVRLQIPYMGKAMVCLTSLPGKIAAVSVVLLGVVLNLAGSRKNADK